MRNSPRCPRNLTIQFWEPASAGKEVKITPITYVFPYSFILHGDGTIERDNNDPACDDHNISFQSPEVSVVATSQSTVTSIWTYFPYFQDARLDKEKDENRNDDRGYETADDFEMQVGLVLRCFSRQVIAGGICGICTKLEII